MQRIQVRAFWGAAALLVVAASLAFGSAAASAAPNFHLGFVTQPADAKGDTGDPPVATQITSVPFDPSGAPVQVELLNQANKRVTNQPVIVDLVLATGPGLATGDLRHVAVTTVDGVATFGSGTLSIAEPNNEQITDFRLTPVTTDGTITGSPSNGFDIWDQACTATETTGCSLTVNHHFDNTGPTDQYASTAKGGLSTTVQQWADLRLVCDGQTPMVSDSVYTSAFTSTAPVAVTSHTTVDEMKAASNNGQAHVSWCIGLDTNTQWTQIGVKDALHEDTNHDNVIDNSDLWVHLAPNCPKKSPSSGAPCITRQYGDGSGGNFTEGFLPGGDPTRRT
jgi:hypothetical protein